MVRVGFGFESLIRVDHSVACCRAQGSLGREVHAEEVRRREGCCRRVWLPAHASSRFRATCASGHLLVMWEGGEATQCPGNFGHVSCPTYSRRGSLPPHSPRVWCPLCTRRINRCVECAGAMVRREGDSGVENTGTGEHGREEECGRGMEEGRDGERRSWGQAGWLEEEDGRGGEGANAGEEGSVGEKGEEGGEADSSTTQVKERRRGGSVGRVGLSEAQQRGMDRVVELPSSSVEHARVTAKLRESLPDAGEVRVWSVQHEPAAARLKLALSLDENLAANVRELWHSTGGRSGKGGWAGAGEEGSSDPLELIGSHHAFDPTFSRQRNTYGEATLCFAAHAIYCDRLLPAHRSALVRDTPSGLPREGEDVQIDDSPHVFEVVSVGSGSDPAECRLRQLPWNKGDSGAGATKLYSLLDELGRPASSPLTQAPHPSLLTLTLTLTPHPRPSQAYSHSHLHTRTRNRTHTHTHNCPHTHDTPSHSHLLSTFILALTCSPFCTIALHSHRPLARSPRSYPSPHPDPLPPHPSPLLSDSHPHPLAHPHPCFLHFPSSAGSLLPPLSPSPLCPSPQTP